ncbi:MAG: cyclic nucleotide-binding domain-containing protein [Pedosphaera sp.]|nr:cyclic nucleotide-binding domain-containing protein [Pedosphaera sp.]
MVPEARGDGFKIWGVDNLVYGPVELPTLVGWVKEQRVTRDTWIYIEQDDVWRKTPDVPELQMFFREKSAALDSGGVPTDPAGAPAPIKPGTLRRVKILAALNDRQLDHFLEFMEVQKVRQWTEIVKQGDHGDAMYLVLEGELRVRLMIGGKESILVTLQAGEFFGEISLFDHGPRSADVIANTDAVLLKITAVAFAKVIKDGPSLVAPILFAIGKTLTARIRADNKRYRDSVNFARTAGA